LLQHDDGYRQLAEQHHDLDHRLHELSVKLTKAGKAGANTLKIGKKKLKPGKYKVTITATDATGNKAKPVVKTLKAKPASCSNRQKRC
jgi:uncharacterized protein YdcH (DUF465 family)